jgi:hypothetical protein
VQHNLGRLDLTGLQPNTSYLYIVRVNCGGSAWSDQSYKIFKTLNQPCYIPTNAGEPYIFSTQVKFTWDSMPGALKYRIRYRVSGTSSWNAIELGNARNSHWQSGLVSGTTYEWQLKTVCEYGLSSGSDWNSIGLFTTQTTQSMSPSLREKEDPDILEMSVELFPNPNKGEFNLILNQYKL